VDVVGLAQTNSDFGCGSYSISAFCLRLVCVNGLITESAMKEIHLGGKLPDAIEFSAETYAKDTDALVSATRDIVRLLDALVRPQLGGSPAKLAEWKSVTRFTRVTRAKDETQVEVPVSAPVSGVVTETNKRENAA